MVKTWITADPHLGHTNCLTFKRADGSPLRPFKDGREHDETIVANWNSVVSPNDLVYVLGDAVFPKVAMHHLGRLMGRKFLIMGNHDRHKLAEYLQYFEKIHAIKVMHDLVLTHVPIHPCSVGRWGTNLHGHLHSGQVMLTKWKPDTRYLCVSVEHTNFFPITLEEAKDMIAKRQKEFPPEVGPKDHGDAS